MQRPKQNRKLIEARFNAGLTQNQLAAAVGLSRPTVAAAEAGEQIRPSTAKKIADYFELQPTDLFAIPEAA